MFERFKAAKIDIDKPSPRERYLRAFARDENGEIVILTLILLVVMLVMGGMAVDFMRFESKRVALQDVSDRAVLAAAELDQTVDAQDLIVSYFESEGLESSIVGTPVVSIEPGSREISVQSAVDMNTIFLRLVGMDELTAPAASEAVEGASSVEISLILDISGSMASSVTDADTGITTTRIAAVKAAAREFVDDVINNDSNPDEVSVSLITYSQQVNIGNGIYEQLNTTPDSLWLDTSGNVDVVREVDTTDANFSSYDKEYITTNEARCVEFNASEFNTTVFDVNRTYQQVETLEYYAGESGVNFKRPLCPHDEEEGIIAHSQDVDQLQDAIDLLDDTTFTSIQLGMKWGVSLLDPSMRPLLANLDDMDPAFAGVRPMEYRDDAPDSENNLKYVILMTDGVNVRGNRLDENYGDDFYYRRAMNTFPWNYYISDRNVFDHPNVSWRNKPSLNNILDNDDYNASTMDSQLESICDAAKDKGIIVFSIAMGLTSDVLSYCASGANRYHETDGSDVGDVFDEIASQITDLRLSL